MAFESYFSNDYAEARDRFRVAAAAAGHAVASLANPSRGPGGEGLTTDIAHIGPRKAGRLLIAMSGTHGVEGFCGSGIQIGWLETGLLARLPAGTAILLIHAINPFGFAWVRRVNEDNIDINRNFVDHVRPHPENPGYRELRDFICPKEWSPESEKRVDAAFAAYAARHGAKALQGAIANGQYWDRTGVFYGGSAPCWSNHTLRSVLAPYADHVRAAAFIDLHTGLGPYGTGEIMSNHPSSDPGASRVKSWFGAEATLLDDGSSSSTTVTGDTQFGVSESLPDATVTGITLEFGTFPVPEVWNSIRADNWLHVHGDIGSAKGRAIKADIRRCFYPDDSEWKRMVSDRAADVLGRALKGLSRS